jgi:hypothetical protein
MLADSGTFPTPTMIVDSGRGIHIYWRIDDAPAGAIWTWQSVEKHLCESLRDIGADPAATDPARLLRLPGTRNSRNGTACKILVINDIRYNLAELAEKYVRTSKPKREKLKKEKKEKQINRISRLYNPYSLHWQRARDLETLCQLRGWQVTGYRNTILHMYAYWTLVSADPEEAREAVYNLNSRFLEPLPKGDVDAVLRSCARAVEDWKQDGESGYNYKNETIVGLLDITLDEQKYMKTIIGAEEKQRRNTLSHQKKRQETRQNEAQNKVIDRYTYIVEMRQKGATQVEIARELGISQGRVSQILHSY